MREYDIIELEHQLAQLIFDAKRGKPSGLELVRKVNNSVVILLRDKRRENEQTEIKGNTSGIKESTVTHNSEWCLTSSRNL